MNEYSNHSLGIGLSSSTQRVGNLRSLGIPTEHTLIDDGSGATTVQTRSVAAISSVIPFSTTAFDSVLGVVGPEGACIGQREDGSWHTVRSVSCHREKRRTCRSAAVGASSHEATTINRGFFNPLTLSAASRAEDIVLGGEVVALSDGTNAPWSINQAASLPTVPLASMAQYVMGATRIGNIVLNDLRSFNFAFGNVLRTPLLGLGTVFAETTHNELHDPMLELTGVDLAKIGAAGIAFGGHAATHANTTLWFKRRLPGGSFYPDNQAVHARLTMNGLVTPVNYGEGSGRSATETKIKVSSVYDATNNAMPVIFQFGIAYNPGF